MWKKGRWEIKMSKGTKRRDAQNVTHIGRLQGWRERGKQPLPRAGAEGYKGVKQQRCGARWAEGHESGANLLRGHPKL